MDLNGEIVLAIENFDENGETLTLRKAFAKDFRAVILPKFVEGLSIAIRGGRDRLILLAIDKLPRLTVGLFIGKRSLIETGELAATPDSGLVKRSEGDG